MTPVIENLRLAELVTVANANRPFFDDFVRFTASLGYRSLAAFIVEPDQAKGFDNILAYLQRPLPWGVQLFDGIARPYEASKAKFFLLSWILRDAPAQRLGPIVRTMPGATVLYRQAHLLNAIRSHVAGILSAPEYWEWAPISEVMVDRLEGSRRAIKGTLFEAIVRRLLAEVFEEHGLPLTTSSSEIRLEGETFDVSVTGPVKIILMPVKTRETMGGGHALLFTRDIAKAIRAAHDAGYECIPVIIAESWGGDLEALGCRHCIQLDMNPNQVSAIEPILKARIVQAIDLFVELAG